MRTLSRYLHAYLVIGLQLIMVGNRLECRDTIRTFLVGRNVHESHAH